MATPLIQQRTNGTTSAAPKLKLAVSRGRVAHPVWVHTYGQEGVGKTTLAAGAPDPLFLDVEQGSLNIETVRFQFDEQGRTRPHDFDEFMEAVRTVEREAYPTYRTLVIDTLDAVEALIWEHICKRDQKANVAAYGFGKGENIVALDEWRKLIAALERVRAKGMNVITLSHAISKRRDDPDGEGWDRWVLKLHQAAAGLIKERADAVLFAKREITRVKQDGKVRGVATDARILCTAWDERWDAKNRHDLPETLPLDWDELASAIAAHKPADPETLKATIKKTAEQLGDELKTKTLGYLADAGDDAVKLAKLASWANAKLAEKPAATDQ